MIGSLLLAIFIVFWWLLGAALFVTFGSDRAIDFLMSASTWKRTLVFLAWPISLLYFEEREDD